MLGGMNTSLRATACGLVLVLVSGLLPMGCGAPPRGPAVPTALIDAAEIPGIPGARLPGNLEDPQFWDFLKKRVLERQKELGLTPGEKIPDAHFLALSGGGQNGAFGAGLLCAWTDRGDRPKFTVVTGISTGALIAPFAFLGPEYDDYLHHMYTTLTDKDLLIKRGVIAGFFGDSMMDSSPLRKVIAESIGEKQKQAIAREYAQGRLLLVATTDLDAGRPMIWDIGAIATSDDPKALQLLRDVLLASASIPVAFPPVMFDVEADGQQYQELHVDGGAAAQVFIYPASFNLKEFSESMRLNVTRNLYVIRNGFAEPEPKTVKRRTMSIAGRAIDSLITTQGVGDLYRIYLEAVRDGLKFHLAIIPDDFTDKPDAMFDPKYMTKLFQLGYDQMIKGTAWISAPPGFEDIPLALPNP